MERTESLMGNGKLFLEGKTTQGGISVKYQLQTTSGPNGQSEWKGFMRMEAGTPLPGSRSASPTPGTVYVLILEDNDGRTGRIQIERAVGQAGGFSNYAIRGQE